MRYSKCDCSLLALTRARTVLFDESERPTSNDETGPGAVRLDAKSVRRTRHCIHASPWSKDSFASTSPDFAFTATVKKYTPFVRKARGAKTAASHAMGSRSNIREAAHASSRKPALGKMASRAEVLQPSKCECNLASTHAVNRKVTASLLPSNVFKWTWSSGSGQKRDR